MKKMAMRPPTQIERVAQTADDWGTGMGMGESGWGRSLFVCGWNESWIA